MTEAEILAEYRTAMQLTENRNIGKAEADWWAELRAMPEYDLLDLSDAIRCAIAATKWAVSASAKPIRWPRKYLVTAIKGALEFTHDRNIDRRASYRDGFRDPGPYVWRPPERASPATGGER